MAQRAGGHARRRPVLRRQTPARALRGLRPCSRRSGASPPRKPAPRSSSRRTRYRAHPPRRVPNPWITSGSRASTPTTTPVWGLTRLPERPRSLSFHTDRLEHPGRDSLAAVVSPEALRQQELRQARPAPRRVPFDLPRGLEQRRPVRSEFGGPGVRAVSMCDAAAPGGVCQLDGFCRCQPEVRLPYGSTYRSVYGCGRRRPASRGGW